MNQPFTIPFLDLKRQYKEIESELQPALISLLENTIFVGGEPVRTFEEEFGRYLGVQHVISMGNGTDALIYALKALHIGPGDEVIVPAFTFIATWEAVSWVGADPVPVDVDPKTFTLDPRKIEEKITPRTRAILPVHIYGNVVDMDGVIEIANRHNLLLIEDAAQAHGAECLVHYQLQSDGEWKKLNTPVWKKAGTIGHVGCFSFYPGKNLGAYGDGGACVTNQIALAERLKLLHDHGSLKKYHHQIIGGNSRLDSLQAVVLSIKLKYLDKWNQKRREIATRYNEFFREFQNVRCMEIPPYGRPVYHIYPLLVPKREKILEKLKEQGIFCGMHYPVPNHLQPAYREMGMELGTFPVAEEIFQNEISLPMFAELTERELEYILSAMKKVL
jgi:dTDP-4-amino-4,6-dideoxygalactose transaminase